MISNNAALSFAEDYSYSDGGGISCHGSLVRNNVISGNGATADAYDVGFAYGGGIWCSNSIITNNTISGNRASGQSAHWVYGWGAGGGICSANTTIINNTLTRNSVSPYGTGGGVSSDSSSTIVNTILWADEAELEPEIDGDPTVTYCDVQGGWPGEGNIDVDPLFRDPDKDDFHLQSLTNPDCGGPGDSPCIDAGYPVIFDTLIDCSWGLGSLRSDIGAYAGGDSLEIGIAFQQEDHKPDRFSLLGNYPNPFNEATIISYQLPASSNVKLEIFNVTGQRVATLVDSREQAGHRSVVWDASGFSSGLYFYRLTAGEFSETKSMMLVK